MSNPAVSAGIGRRDFLRLSAIVGAGAGIGVTGLAEIDPAGLRAAHAAQGPWIPTSCNMCGGTTGVFANVVNGRVLKIEPNAFNPVGVANISTDYAQLKSTGARMCPKGNAAIMSLYDPDRIKRPLKRPPLPMMCQQCDRAPCKATCDSLGYRAIVRRPDGILYVDPALCVGCQKCIPVCPYNSMSFNTQKTNKLGTAGVAEKCHFCMHRLDAGLLPACVITCQGITLEYGGFGALQAKYPGAKRMGDDVRPKVLYGNLGDEPKRPTAGYPNPVPFHDAD